MLAQNKSGWTLLEYLKVSEEEIENYDPVTGAFAVISVNGEFLIGYVDECDLKIVEMTAGNTDRRTA